MTNCSITSLPSCFCLETAERPGRLCFLSELTLDAASSPLAAANREARYWSRGFQLSSLKSVTWSAVCFCRYEKLQQHRDVELAAEEEGKMEEDSFTDWCPALTLPSCLVAAVCWRTH